MPEETCVERIHLPPAEPLADANIRRRYAIEEAAWIWHPGCGPDEPVVLRFSCGFSTGEREEFLLHVSGDQRYELFLDGELLSRGPDRCDLAHWSFASYRVGLAPGEHRLEAVVWWIGDLAPAAQVSHRGGFICAAEGLEDLLNSGTGSWKVRRVQGISFGPGLPGHYHVIGPSFVVDGREYFADAEAVDAAVIDRFEESDTGIVHPGWQLHPSPLPDQKKEKVRPGRVRAFLEGSGSDPVPAEALVHPDLPAWQETIEGKGSLVVEPGRQVHAIWDLEDYYCGYLHLTLSGGAGSEVAIEWAESLFEPAEEEIPRCKGNRDQVEGKLFWGFGDRFRSDGGEDRAYTSLWWRSGRYVRISVSAGEQPLEIRDLFLEETGYPLELEGDFEAGYPTGPDRMEEAPDLGAIVPLAVRGIQMCAHETFMDCPYYEQMMYVGDTRLEILALYTMSRDDRLVRRAIELFDWSRWKTGFVAERYPSDPYQLSLTYSMLWVSMLRDYVMWRDDLSWARMRLPGMRSLLEHFRLLLGRKGLLERLPGWSFVDWVPEWRNGVPPSGREGISAPINLLFVQALRHAAEVEEAVGEPSMAERNRRFARQVGDRLIQIFWAEEEGLLADDPEHEWFSEHTQCLALLNDLLDEEKRRRCWLGLLSRKDLCRATVYFSFYLLETFGRFGRGDLIVGKMRFWDRLVGRGFRTPVESPEPSRSDCHAWGSHPLFHFHATLAGIRPLRPGFQTVLVEPSPGPLSCIRSRLPHPRGEIDLELERDSRGGNLRIRIGLPTEVDGLFRWQGREYELSTGSETVLMV